MPNKNKYFLTLLLAYSLPIILTPSLWAMEKVSLKTLPQTGIIVTNPMVIASLPHRKTYQVNHEAFTLQFFFNEKDIFGMILKRDKRRPVHFRWCFFRSCEESTHDYRKVIAEPSSPPFALGFFSIPYPFYLPYGFQGIEFSSPEWPSPDHPKTKNQVFRLHIASPIDLHIKTKIQPYPLGKNIQQHNK